MGREFTKAGELPFMKVFTADRGEPPEAPVSPLVEKALDSLGKAMAEQPGPEIQLPLWFEPERGTPNSFLRSALFAAIQSKDRRFLKEVTLASSRDVTL